MDIQEFIHGVEGLRSNLLKQARHYLNDADDAEDAVQETLVKLWVVRDRVAEASKMRNMAAVVCRNVSLNMLRDKRQTVSIDGAWEVASHANPEIQLEEREGRQRLQRNIRALTDKQRAMLRMRNVENMQYADIAKIMGTSESSVRGMISKARMALVQLMKGTEL